MIKRAQRIQVPLPENGICKARSIQIKYYDKEVETIEHFIKKCLGESWL